MISSKCKMQSSKLKENDINKKFSLKTSKTFNFKLLTLNFSTGFTLAELLIATALGVIVSGALVAILINNTEVVYKQSSRVSQGLDINSALANVKSYLKQASLVAVSYPESPSPTYTSSSSELVLKITSVDQNDEAITNTYDYVIYYKDQDKLRVLIEPNALSSRDQMNTILASNLDQIIFDYLDTQGNPTSPTAAKKVKTTIILKQKAGSRYETNIATAEANLRND